MDLIRWFPEPTVLLGLLALQFGYVACVGPWRRRFAGSARVSRGQQIWFMLGVVALGLALASPLDTLGDNFLLSAHMVQHLLLTIVAPPLLLLGLPGWLLRPALAWRGVRRGLSLMLRPGIAFALVNITYFLWHIPIFYEAALQARPIHIAEHLSMLFTALIMWWPLLGVLPEFPRLAYPLQMLYVFGQTLPGALLGIILAMAPGPLYPTYVAAPRLWAVDALQDQRIAGLIMWVGTNLFWLVVLTTIFFVWAAREQAGESDDRAPASQSTAVRRAS